MNHKWRDPTIKFIDEPIRLQRKKKDKAGLVIGILTVLIVWVAVLSISNTPAPAYRHAAEASYGEEPKPRGHGR
jgi:hypothetical protein